MNLHNPLFAVAAVGVMQLVALMFVFGWYAIRDRYGHDCDHGDHKLGIAGVQTPVDLGAAFTAKRTTIILYRCRACQSYVETVTVDGAWTLDVLTRDDQADDTAPVEVVA
jgi:hypothetical protein